MKNDILPFSLGAVSTLAELSTELGKRYIVDSVEYILVKSTGTITAAKLFIQWADAEAFTVDAVGGAAETKGAIAGLGIVGQDAVVSGDYFFLIRKGAGTAQTQTTGLAKEVAVATHGTTGEIDDGTVTFATAVAYTREAQASANADVAVFVDLP